MLKKAHSLQKNRASSNWNRGKKFGINADNYK